MRSYDYSRSFVLIISPLSICALDRSKLSVMTKRGYRQQELKPAHLLMLQCKHDMLRLNKREVGDDSKDGSETKHAERFRDMVELLRKTYGEATMTTKDTGLTGKS